MPEWTTKQGLWQKAPWLLLFVGVFALLISLLRGESDQDASIDQAHRAVLESQQQVKRNAVIMEHVHADVTELKRLVADQCKDKKAPKWR